LVARQTKGKHNLVLRGCYNCYNSQPAIEGTAHATIPFLPLLRPLHWRGKGDERREGTLR